MAGSADAGTGITIGITNADGGVYWRSGPDWNTKQAISGYGVYNNSVVELECYAWGAGLPAEYGSTSTLWYYATHVGGSGYGSGYVHDHFVNTPWNVPNRVVSGVPQCGASSGGSPGGSSPTPGASSTPPDGGAVYYQPRYNSRDPQAPSEVETIGLTDWSAGNCDSVKATFPDTYNGKRVTTLAGWSVGRLGPMYAIDLDMNRVNSRINMIILYDPGSYANFFDKNGCDKWYDESWHYANWLAADPNHELLILAGHDTYDPNWRGVGSHQGIQQKLFPAIRGKAIASQVAVCNYNSMSHPDVLRNFGYLMTQGRTTSCPRGVTPWHP